MDCKTYINIFQKKINKALNVENFDKYGQLFIPIKGECYEDVKNDMITKGFKSYFKNERLNNLNDCNCLRIFIYKNKLYFMDWYCE